ncbi:MAG: hypothetical protein QM696_04320 [Steroidobacteraceae bacterium]
MRPLAALLGVLLGSAVAIFTGLTLTLVVYLFLPEYHDRLSQEFLPLLKAVGWSAVLVAAVAGALVSELRQYPKRHLMLAVAAATLVAFAWAYWP